MRRLTLVVLAVFLMASPCLKAQIAHVRDTSSVFAPSQLVAPGVLAAGGVLIHSFAHDTWDVKVRDAVQDLRAKGPETHFEDYVQYAPYVFDLALGLTGVSAEHCFVDRIFEAGLSFAASSALAWAVKIPVRSLRPNGLDFRSFPSGHTCTVFAGAELVRMEYGWGWGAGAYAVAATVGFMRMYNDWHWASDVLLGAGIGILSAHVGEWLLQPVKNLLRIPDFDSRGMTFTASVDPVSGIPCAGLALAF